MKKHKRLLITLITLGLLSFFFYYHYEKPKDKPKNQVITVTTTKVVQKNVAVQIHAIGNVQAYATVGIKSLVDGQILSVNFKQGDTVTANQILFNIDPRPFQVQLEEAQAKLIQAHVQYQQAVDTLNRNKKLLKDSYLSQEDYDQLNTNVSALAAAEKAAAAAVSNAQLQLSYCTIRAPISGRTGNLLVDVGNLIKANDTTSLLVINQINPIYVNFTLPEQELPAIQKAFSQSVVTVTAKFNKAYPVNEQGTLSFINNAVDTNTGTIQLKATFTNADHLLWPGQFVRVELPIAHVNNALLIPTLAIQAGPAGSYVFVINANHTVTLRYVTTGAVISNQTIITKGLAANEEVVLQGQLRLDNGTLVKVDNSTGIAS